MAVITKVKSTTEGVGSVSYVPLGSILGLIPHNTCINNCIMRWTTTLVGLQAKLCRVAGAKRQSCRPECPQQAVEMDWQTLCEVQQRQIQSLTPKTDSWLEEEWHCWKRLGKPNTDQQYTLAAMKINNMLFYVSTSKTSRSRQVIISLYLALGW